MDLMTKMIGPVLIFLMITGSSICAEKPSERIEKFQSSGKKNKGPGKVESRFFGFDGNMGQLFPGSGNNQGPQSGGAGTPTNPGGTGFPANSQFYPGGALQNPNPPFPTDSTGIDDAKNYPLQNNPGIQQYPNPGIFGPSNQNQGNFGRQQMPGVIQGNFGGFSPGQNTGGIPQNPNQGNYNEFPQQRPGQRNFGGMQYPGQANGFPVQYPNQNGGMPMQYPSQNGAGRFPQMQYPNSGNFGTSPLQFPNQGNIGGPQQNTQFPNQENFGPTQTQYPNQGNFGGLPQNMQYPNQGNFGATQAPYYNRGNVGNMPPQYPNQGSSGNPAYPGAGLPQAPIPIPDENISGGFTSAPDFDGQQFPSDGGFGNQNNQGSGQFGDGTVDSLVPGIPNPNDSNPQIPEGPRAMDEASAILGRPVIVPPVTSGDKIVFPGSPDTPSQRQCVQDCQTTTEYNPVCGTNNVTYINPGKFVCARNCGVVVYVHRRGRCPDTTPTSRPIIG